MFKEKKIMFLIAETPVHAGSGSGIGVIDLPIQRERHTDFPKIESSGLKGCLRDVMMSSNKPSDTGVKPLDVTSSENETGDQSKKVTYLSLLFGSEVEEAFSGAVSVTDAKILLFPVKSLKGIFCWITCPMVLERFRRDLKLAGVNDMDKIDFNSMPNTVSD
ncbi:MAG: type III-B CRISPR module RAMP protein Cmr4, partial [Candidatus Micrarchaeota archaeon]|nr:type III-B CRISPR module RAMP protein Cmr4 [Candidatus Micrarchaeota archaeon]